MYLPLQISEGNISHTVTTMLREKKKILKEKYRTASSSLKRSKSFIVLS